MPSDYDNPVGSAYELIGVGPVVSRNYTQQLRPGIDGSNKLARELSPFKISFLAPDIYGNVRRLSEEERKNLDDERKDIRRRNQFSQVEASLRQSYHDLQNWLASLSGKEGVDPVNQPEELESSGTGTVAPRAGKARRGKPKNSTDIQLTEHFWRSDFKSRHDGIVPDRFLENARAVAVEMEKMLLAFRTIANNPSGFFRIISTYRGPKHHEALESRKKDKTKRKKFNPAGQHSQAKAIDVTFPGLTEIQMFQIASSMMDGTAFTGAIAGRSSSGGVDISLRLKQGGLGVYPTSKTPFIHYDIRGKRERWGQGGSVRDLPSIDPDEAILAELASISSATTPAPVQERERALEEKGVSVESPPMSRSLANLTLPKGFAKTLDAAGRSYDSFEDAKAANQEGLLIGMRDLAGPLPNFVHAERFVVDGLEKRSRSGSGRYDDPTLIDRATAVDIATQIYEMRRVPPLVLMINPNSLSINYTQIQQFTERNNSGYIFQRWGEDQPTISFSGEIGAFITGSSETGKGAGFHWSSKRDSVAFQNLMHLLIMYRNNGYIYDRIGRTNAMRAVGSIAIEFDQWVYIGNFDSFDYGYTSESAQGKLEFNCEFTVNRMFDVAHSPTEPLKPMRSVTKNPVSISPGREVINPVSPGSGDAENGVASIAAADEALGEALLLFYDRFSEAVGGIAESWSGALAPKNQEIPPNSSGFSGPG